MYKIVSKLESLSGLFTLTTYDKMKSWKGATHLSSISDYDTIIEYGESLDKVFQYKEFIIIECLTKLLLILENSDGDIAFCEQEWVDNIDIASIDLKVGEVIDIENSVIQGNLILFDSTLDHSEIQIPLEDGIYKSGFGTSNDILFRHNNSSQLKIFKCEFEAIGEISLNGIVLKFNNPNAETNIKKS